jgi:hypothetical protein
MASLKVPAARWRAYRARTFRLPLPRRVRTVEAAVRFVNERGFVYFWPIKGVDLPSLWVAVAGDRPVADAHDDPGHVTWGWKDRLLGARRWFYAKLLRGKATLVALDTLPFFYALSDNYGDFRADYLDLFAEGRLTADARAIYEVLLERGALDSVALRREARMTSKGSNTRFERALAELQTGLKIMPVAVAEAGAWRYAFVYEIVDRFYPELAGHARPIARGEARRHLADLYLRSVGAATPAQLKRLFRWPAEETQRTCDELLETRRAVAVAEVAGRSGEWLATPKLT